PPPWPPPGGGESPAAPVEGTWFVSRSPPPYRGQSAAPEGEGIASPRAAPQTTATRGNTLFTTGTESHVRPTCGKSEAKSHRARFSMTVRRPEWAGRREARTQGGGVPASSGSRTCATSRGPQEVHSTFWGETEDAASRRSSTP